MRSVLISEFEEKQLLPSPRYEILDLAKKPKSGAPGPGCSKPDFNLVTLQCFEFE